MNNDMLMDDHDDIIAHIWQQLRRGAKDRRHGFHTLTIANALPDGGAAQRVMVLREADISARLLRFHTDMRAAKCDMIGSESPISYWPMTPRAKNNCVLRHMAELSIIVSAQTLRGRKRHHFHAAAIWPILPRVVFRHSQYPACPLI